MTTAYQHRPLSAILAPAPEKAPDGSTAAPVVAAPAVPEVDPKYAGKSVNDVIEMHQNAESRLGQIQNEVGSLRGLVTELSEIQRSAAPSVEEQEPVTVSGEELIADPVEAINRIIKPQLEKAEAAAEQRTADSLVDTESRALVTEFGDVNAIVSTPEFQAFAQRTPTRNSDFHTAAKGEGMDQVRAARRLLEDFKDFQSLTAPQTTTIAPDVLSPVAVAPVQQIAPQAPVAQLPQVAPVAPAPTPVQTARAVTTEAGGVGAPLSGKAQIFESDVIALINSDVTMYRSPSYQAELMLAIKEGRFVANS